MIRSLGRLQILPSAGMKSGQPSWSSLATAAAINSS